MAVARYWMICLVLGMHTPICNYKFSKNTMIDNLTLMIKISFSDCIAVEGIVLCKQILLSC